MIQPRYARAITAVLIVAGATFVADVARAEDRFTVDTYGEADGTGDTAKTAALDRAFARAVSEAITTLVPRETATRHRRALVDNIIRRARLYIASYHITKLDKTESGLRVRIAATVDRDKIRGRLTQLGIGQTAESTAPASRPKLALVVAAKIDDATYATFGQYSAGFVGNTIAESFEARGFSVASTAGLPLQVTSEAAPGLPAGDSAAIELATRVGAGGAIVCGVQAQASGRIRGTLLYGALAKVRIRALDAQTGEVVTTHDAEGVGFGTDAADAAARAARDGLGQAVRSLGFSLAQYWPPPATADNALLVTVRGAPTWRGIRAVIAQLEGTPGITKVTPRQFSRGRAVLAVSTRIGARRVAASARAADLPAGAAAIRIEGDAVYVDVSSGSF